MDTVIFGDLTLFDVLIGGPVSLVVGMIVGTIISAYIFDSKAVERYLAKRMGQLYFCNYTLHDVYAAKFFNRYHEFTDWGFCCPVAGINMLALKGNRTARFVLAMAGEEPCWHCWVEFRYRGIWYAIDPCWYYALPVMRRVHDLKTKPKIIEVCDYERFWSYAISQQLYEKMQHADTSWLIAELMSVFRVRGETPENLFPEEIEQLRLDAGQGEHIHTWLFLELPEIVFSRRIMHEFMQKPTRKRPSAHRIRTARRIQKIAKQRYDEYVREHPELQSRQSSDAEDSVKAAEAAPA